MAMGNEDESYPFPGNVGDIPSLFSVSLEPFTIMGVVARLLSHDQAG